MKNITKSIGMFLIALLAVGNYANPRATEALKSSIANKSISDTTIIKHLVKAESYYKAGKFASAIKVYKSLKPYAGNSGRFYFNMANAYYKNNQKYEALGYYLKANALLNNNENVNKHIERLSIELGIDTAIYDESVLQKLLSQLSTNLLYFLIFGLNLLLFVLLAKEVYFKKGGPFLKGATLTLMALVFSVIVLKQNLLVPKAFIKSDEAYLYSAPTKQAVKLLPLHKGDVLNLSGKKNNWIKVDHQGSIGWLSRKQAILLIKNG